MLLIWQQFENVVQHQNRFTLDKNKDTVFPFYPNGYCINIFPPTNRAIFADLMYKSHGDVSERAQLIHVYTQRPTFYVYNSSTKLPQLIKSVSLPVHLCLLDFCLKWGWANHDRCTHLLKHHLWSSPRSLSRHFTVLSYTRKKLVDGLKSWSCRTYEIWKFSFVYICIFIDLFVVDAISDFNKATGNRTAVPPTTTTYKLPGLCTMSPGMFHYQNNATLKIIYPPN